MAHTQKRQRLTDACGDGPPDGPDDAVNAMLAILEGAPGTHTPGGLSEHDMTSTTAQRALELLAEQWTSKPDTDESILDVAARRFGVLDQLTGNELMPHGPHGLQTLYKRKTLAFLRLRYHFVRLGLLDVEDESMDVASVAYKTAFSRLHECLKRQYDVLMTTLLARKSLDPHWASECPDDVDPYGVKPFDHNQLNAVGKYVVFVLEQLQKNGLRRYRGACWEEVMSPPVVIDGRPKSFKTHAWRRCCDIREFVYRITPKETHFGLWNLTMTSNAVARTIEYLTYHVDVQFPDLEPDRHYHAFQNGIYCTYKRTFLPWGHPSITPDITCCRYHDVAFDVDMLEHGEAWHEIPTPNFDRIFDVQFDNIVHTEVDERGQTRRHTAETAAAFMGHELAVYKEWADLQRSLGPAGMSEADIAARKPPEIKVGDAIEIKEGRKVRVWAYAMIGRLLYEVNYVDKWQVMPMFVGRAGTGKSLILSTVSKFFDETDIGVIANDQQKGFGLESIYDKKLWMIKEVKSDMTLDQAQLQSMISGEEMSIMRKNLTPVQVVWKSPGIMAGNELANWTDNSGSMSRRLLLFYFHKRVKQSDPHLPARLEQEFSAIMHKCNSAYAHMKALYGHCDLWARDPDADPGAYGSKTILPSFFHHNKSSLKQQTHIMENFLNNQDEVEICGATSKRGMPFELDHGGRPSFKTLANEYFKKTLGQKSFAWHKEDRYKATFEDYELQVRRLTQQDCVAKLNVYDGQVYPVGTNWLFGVVPRVKEGLPDE